MIAYNTDEKRDTLYINLPLELKYNFTFMDDVTELLLRVEQSSCSKVRFSYINEEPVFDKMGIAFLYAALWFLSKKKEIFVNRFLYELFNEKVVSSDISKFEKINVNTTDIQLFYKITNEKDTQKVSQKVVEFIQDNNFILKKAKMFLITVIGEMFSNAFNHSDENEVFFMYDIESKNGNFYLVVNIMDFGKTIIQNVKAFQKRYFNRKMTSKECMDWAIQNGNTTRIGSGGYGLPSMIESIKEIEGELLLFSGDSIYTLENNNARILNAKGLFFGTSVSMKIPVFNSLKMINFDEKANKIISVSLDDI